MRHIQIVFIVRGYMGHASWISGVFDTEEKAKEWVQEKMKINADRRFDIDPFGVQ